MKSLSVDIETKVLNDLNEKLYGIQEKMIRQPELLKVVRNVQRPDLSSPEFVFAYHVFMDLLMPFICVEEISLAIMNGLAGYYG